MHIGKLSRGLEGPESHGGTWLGSAHPEEWESWAFEVTDGVSALQLPLTQADGAP